MPSGWACGELDGQPPRQKERSRGCPRLPWRHRWFRRRSVRQATADIGKEIRCLPPEDEDDEQTDQCDEDEDKRVLDQSLPFLTIVLAQEAPEGTGEFQHT